MKKRKLILGWGKSGKAAAELLKENIFIFDHNQDLDFHSYDVVFQLDEALLDKIDQIIISPGFDFQHPFLAKARKKKIEIIGEVELAFRHIKNRTVGITGTNGKTTTTLLCCHFLKQNQIPARALGNIGRPLCSYVHQIDPEEILICELSSFQLQTLTSKCLDIAVILNISPNHLDQHKNYEEYIDAKKQIRCCLKPEGKFLVSQKVKEEFFKEDEYEVFEERSDFFECIPAQNIEAAKWICKKLGARAFSLKNFEKPPHRLQFVAKKGGVFFYNDSKATNVEAVISAVNALKGSILLICGGVCKGYHYKKWKKAFKGKVEKIFTIGNSAQKIRKELESDFQVQIEKSLQDAVLNAFKCAKPNDCILLSPGCSSFDQFKNFEERGEKFMKIVQMGVAL